MAKISPTALRKEISERFTAQLLDYAKNNIDEDAALVADGAFMFPTLDSEGNDWYVKVTISVPTGERGGNGYDGYEEAKAYEHEKAEKLEKKAKAEALKQAKIAKDKARREAAAKAKAEHEAEKANAK